MYNDPGQPQQPPFDPSRTEPGQPQFPPNQNYPINPGYPVNPNNPNYQNYPNYGMPPQQPRKRSLRWLWITLSIIGGLAVIICAAIIILVFVVGRSVAPTVGSITTATEYYTAIRRQNYAQAYSYIDTGKTTSIQGQAVTQETFTRLATVADTARGPVTNFSIQNIDTQHPENVTVHVTRGSQSYDVHLVLTQVGNNWKITQIDNI